MASLYQHILIPIDFTPKNQAAIKVAQGLAEGGQTRVTLAHVVHEIEGTETEEFQSFYDRLLLRARTQLEEYASLLRNTTVVEHVVVGKPLVELVRFMNETNVDLVVLSSHRIDLQQGMQGWGTLSYQLSVVSPCQALLVK